MKFPDLLTPSSPKLSNLGQRTKPEAFEGRDYHNERDTKIGWKNGAGERTRTPNLQIRSLLISTIREYKGLIKIILSTI